MDAETMPAIELTHKTTLSDCDKSFFPENSSFSINDQINTPSNHQPDCNEILFNNTADTIRTKETLGCTNKMCDLYVGDREAKHLKIQPSTLCDKCRRQFKKDSYCVYCKQIYFDTTDDGKEWIMCEECQRWVHSHCADFDTKDTKAIFKCIKCKKTQNDYSRRYNPRNMSARVDKKRTNVDFLSGIGFEWELSASELAQDMEKIKQYLQ